MMKRAVRQVTMVIAAGVVLALGTAAPVFAGVTCSFIPAMCPPSTGPGNHSVPEPGTLGLLAVGAVAGITRLRRHLKKKG
jgi:PEP-CTERM motif